MRQIIVKVLYFNLLDVWTGSGYIDFNGIVENLTLELNIELISGKTDAETRKKDIDSHKDDSVNKAKDGKGHWKRDLASQSEAAVRFD